MTVKRDFLRKNLMGLKEKPEAEIGKLDEKCFIKYLCNRLVIIINLCIQMMLFYLFLGLFAKIKLCTE